MARPSVATERRSQIVKAVIEILSRDGWDGLTLRRISEVSTLSNGAVSHFAGRKEEMIAEAVRRHYEAYSQRAQEVMAEGTPFERLENWVRDIVAPGEENEFEWACWIALWGRAPFEELISSELKLVYRTHAQRLAAVIREGVAAGEFSLSRPVETVADEAVALVDGFALRRLVDPDVFPPERVRELILRFLVEELNE